MADIRITSLALLTSVDPVNDPLVIEDVSSGETKKTTAEYLKIGMSLGNVDNTSDLNKPISTATQAALDGKQSVITGAATTIVSSNLTASIVLISDASGKVAASSVSSTELGYLSGVTSAIQTQLNSKQGSLTLTTTGTSGAATLIGNTLNIPQYSGGSGVAGVSSLEGLTGDLSLVAGSGISITDNGSNTITITNIGGGGGSVAWGDITGTLSDQTDLQSALDGKEATITAGTTAQYYRGDKTFQTLDKAAVGLSNVDNTSDLNKPISTATQTALDAKQATITGAATTIDTEDLTASRALVSDGSGKVAVSSVTSTELGYVSGVTSAVQTQINSKQATLSVDANEGLTLVSNSLGTIYNTTIGDTVQSIAVGGAPAQAASVWKSLTLVQALDTILFPTILASITTNKSVTLTISGTAGTLEIGQTISRTLTASFNQGRITNGDNTLGPLLVGAATQYTFTGTGISSTAQAGNTLVVSNTIVSGSNNWAVTVNHDAGTGDYFDNKGNVGTNLDASRVSGTATDSASSPTVTGVYPYFYLKSSSPISSADMASAIAAGTATKVVASSTGTLAIPYNVNAQYLAVAYPAASTTKTKYYVTALDNGDITVVFEPVATESVNSPDSYWSGISYKVHVSKSALTNSNATIELRNS